MYGLYSVPSPVGMLGSVAQVCCQVAVTVVADAFDIICNAGKPTSSVGSKFDNDSPSTKVFAMQTFLIFPLK